jgi:hypothetical protein
MFLHRSKIAKSSQRYRCHVWPRPKIAPTSFTDFTTVADTSLVVEDEQARLHQAELTRLQIALGLRQGVKEDCMMVDIDALLFIS